jgi:Rrf2 family protein
VQLSNTVEYALRAVVWLADRPRKSYTSVQIAEATYMPGSYLSKILQGLSRTGIVVGQRGVHGGFSLAKEPEELTLLEVVNAVEPVQRIHDCPLGIDAHGKNLCNLHRILDDLLIQIEQTYAQVTIQDLLKKPNKSKPLCGVTVRGRKSVPKSVASRKTGTGIRQ